MYVKKEESVHLQREFTIFEAEPQGRGVQEAVDRQLSVNEPRNTGPMITRRSSADQCNLSQSVNSFLCRVQSTVVCHAA